MIRGALLHLPGIGPVRAARLRELGVRDWGDLGLSPPAGLRMGSAAWAATLAAVSRCAEAHEGGDIAFFARTLRGPDLWRVLATYGERAAFVDIETDGLHRGARITVVACLWRDRLYTFVQGESLDEFLDLLQQVELMVTFNGASFDVPMILREFHIPSLPCSHVDLRWVCYHAGWRGGLKAVESMLGLQRPGDLQGVDGAEAVELWLRWQRQQRRRDRDRLVRYCAADAVALRGVAGVLLRRCGCACAFPDLDAVWSELNDTLPAPGPDEATASKSPAASVPPASPGPAKRVSEAHRDASPEDIARRRLREMLRRRFAPR